MSDVFISYARSTTEREAKQIADALRSLGYAVWRDDQLPAHRSFTEVIEEHLTAAKAVVVIWSAEAAKSEWVQSEADTARLEHKLVQLTIDGSKLPRPFDRTQCADLTGWSGDPEHAGWRTVLASIAELVSGSWPPAAPATITTLQPVAGPLLAVLAFDNLSGDPEMTYFSDGVSEEVQQTVARGTDLRVIGRTSSFQLRGPDKAIRKVVAELKATHVLDGSVRRGGSRVRVSAQLIECAGETTLWSERFDRDLTDIFALQDEIAGAVAAALKIAFAPTVARPVDPAAYDLYLKARDRSAPLGVAERIQMLELAVALAPDFAQAWVSLAQWRFNRAQRERERLALAPLLDEVRAALEVAERLDPQLGATRVVRAFLEPYATFFRREALLREARRLSPGDAQCLIGMSGFLGQVGRRREGLALAEEAAARDPLSPDPEYLRTALSDAAYETEMKRVDASRARWPYHAGITVGAAWMAAAAGDWPKYEVLAEHARAQTFAEFDTRLMRETFQFCEALRDGDQAYFGRLVSTMEAGPEHMGAVRLDAAARAAQAGRIEETFAALDRASFDAVFEPGGGTGGGLVGGWGAAMIFSMALAGAMIRDPRFLRLCAKLGLVSYWLETGQWPDCADEVSYDFRAEAKKLASEGLARHV